MRYLLQKSGLKPGALVCTDTGHLIVCTFENKRFNETQEFTMLEDFKADDYMILARLLREMSDWLGTNHPEKV